MEYLSVFSQLSLAIIAGVVIAVCIVAIQYEMRKGK